MKKVFRYEAIGPERFDPDHEPEHGTWVVESDDPMNPGGEQGAPLGYRHVEDANTGQPYGLVPEDRLKDLYPSAAPPLGSRESDEPPMPEDRFIISSPMLPIGPDEIYLAATSEEMLEGKTGRIVKNPALTRAERAALRKKYTRPEPAPASDVAAGRDEPLTGRSAQGTPIAYYRFTDPSNQVTLRFGVSEPGDDPEIVESLYDPAVGKWRQYPDVAGWVLFRKDELVQISPDEAQDRTGGRLHDPDDGIIPNGPSMAPPGDRLTHGGADSDGHGVERSSSRWGDVVMDRRTKLARIAAAHREWEDAWMHMADGLYDPAKDVPGSDYNQHVLDVEATPEMLDDLDRRVREKLSEP